MIRPQTHELIWIRGQQPLLVQQLHGSSGWDLVIVGHAFQPFCKQALMNTPVTLSILVCTQPTQVPAHVGTPLLVPFQYTQPLMRRTVRIARSPQRLHLSHLPLCCPQVA